MQRWLRFSRDSARHIPTILELHKDQQRGEKQRRGEKELCKTAALFAAHSMLSGCNREITNKVDLRSEKGR